MLKSRPQTTQSSRSLPMKEYTTEGLHIPLKKNWLDTWCTLHETFDPIFKEVLDFEVRSDDVFVVTFIKAGTTWMQETAWLLMNNLDFEKSKQAYVLDRSPFLEHHGLCPQLRNTVEFCQTIPSPRLIKSHLPANCLPRQIWQRQQNQKIIYVARNCKDVVVSSYHFTKNLGVWCGDNIEDYVDDFMNNEIMYTSYWTHVVDFWKMRHEPFIFFVTYEEMQRDLAGVVQRLCQFLERPQLTPAEMDKMLQHLSFDSMKENKQTNLTYKLRQDEKNINENFEFMRRGIVGSYHDELTPESQAKIDNWSRQFLAQHQLTEEDIFGRL